MKQINIKNLKNKTIWILSGVLIVSLILTFSILLKKQNPTESSPSLDNTSEASSKEETAIPTPTTSSEHIEYEELIKDINNYLENFDGRIGLYYINLSTRESFGINEKTPFIAANSIKLPIATLIYNRVLTGDISLTDTLDYDDRPYPEGDMTPGQGFIINEGNGTTYSIRRISQLAITISDNCAANMMIRSLGGIDEVGKNLDLISSIVPYRSDVEYIDFEDNTAYGRHRTSPKDLAIYTRYLYDLWINTPDNYAPLIDDLSNTVFDFGIKANLPEEIKVAHKIGSNADFGTQNDVGIIFTDTPYVLSIMTEFDDPNLQRTIISEVSKIIYDYFNS